MIGLTVTTSTGITFSDTTTIRADIARSGVLNLTIDNVGRWKIPISARLVDSRHEVNARVILEISCDHDFYYFPPGSGDPVIVHTADALIIDDNTTERAVIPTGNFSIPDGAGARFSDIMSASMGVGFRSAFAQRFERIIITPNGDGASGLLVLDPSTPEQYAYEGQWFYVNSLHEQYPKIEAVVVVGDYPASSPARFVLTSNSYLTFIPTEAFDNIVGHLERAGFNVATSTVHNLSDEVPIVGLERMGEFEILRFHRISAYDLAQALPPIHFEMVSGTRRFRIAIFPEDYIQASPFGHGLSIYGFVNGNQYQIGTNVLRRVGLSIDYRNRRIGFAEPLTEN
jgi:hypothetical protein